MNKTLVSGSFDDLRSPQVRFLQEAARSGPVHVVLWSDQVVADQVGQAPKFPFAERRYFVESLRYVAGVVAGEAPLAAESLPLEMLAGATTWAVDEASHSTSKAAFCQAHGLTYRVVRAAECQGFPLESRGADDSLPARKKVIVTGCYDWVHTGHVRFFEEVSELGALYAVVGNDANIRFLKGEGHPLLGEQERRYMVHSIRFVTQALITSGQGWLDAEPEIVQVQPDIYAVNEDGDRPEKREYCAAHGIEYRVLKRTPKPGLPRRQSTDLRGF